MSTQIEEPDAPSRQTAYPLARCAILSCTQPADGDCTASGTSDARAIDATGALYVVQAPNSIADSSSHTIALSDSGCQRVHASTQHRDIDVVGRIGRPT